MEEDWEIIQSLSVDIANAVSANDHRSARVAKKKIFIQLARLESKYGKLPSLLATRADYVDDEKKRIRLLEDAWELAKCIHDKANIVFIASSLAETFVDELHDLDNGQKWLERLEDALGERWDDDEYKTMCKLKQQLEKFK